MAQRSEIVEEEYKEVHVETEQPDTVDTRVAQKSIREYKVPNAERISHEDRELIDIRTEIAQTRRETRETLKAIKSQLRPDYLRSQAQDKVREMTVDRAKNAADSAKRKVKKMSSNLFDTMRDNWIPTAMITGGIAWLVKENRDGRNGRHVHTGDMGMAYGEAPQYYEWENAPDDQFRPRNPYAGEPIPEGHNGRGQSAIEGIRNIGTKTSHAASRAGEKTRSAAQKVRRGASRFGEDTRYQYGRARRGFFEELQENPLMIAGAALAIGAFFGLVIPETEYENEMMGEYRDEMINEVKKRGQDTFERAQHVVEHAAEEAMSAAREEAERQDLTT